MKAFRRTNPAIRTLLIMAIACLLMTNGGSLIYALETNNAAIQLPPLADTYMNGGSLANTNYGTSPILQVRTWTGDPNYSRESYMKFDLSSYTGELGTATLNVYAVVNNANGSPLAFQLYGMEDDSWSENMTTWNDKPVMDHYLANVNVGLTWKWIQVDVTSFVKAQLESDQVASFGFTQGAKSGALIHINSKESTANQPYLSLSHTRVNPAAPKWPSGASVEVVQLNENGLDLKWSEPEGSAGNYRVLQNGKSIATVTGTTYHIPTQNADIGKTYTFKIEAGSTQNQWSQDGPYVTVNIPITELKQIKTGNVFTENEPIQFKVAALQSTVTWSVYDMQGAKISEGTGHNDKGQILIQVPFSKRGYFKLVATVGSTNQQPQVSLETSFAVLSPYDFTAVADSPFGIATHLHRGQTSTIPLIQQAGAKSVRDGIEWHAIEKTKGVYTFNPTPDNYMVKLKEQGIGMVFVAAYNNPFYDNNGTPYTDQGREGFANYAEAYVDYYKDQLIAMEAYNEFNGGFGKRGNSPANSRPEYYFKLLKKTYETVKSQHPEFPVFGIVASEDAVSWIEEVFKLGGLQYMDAVTLHPYRYPDEPEGVADSMEQIKALIRQYNNGQDKPIWITEFGYPTFKAANGIDEIKQANYLVRYYVSAISSGVEKIYWYDLANDGLRNDYNEDNFGLLRNAADPLGAFAPKPAYAAYAAMTRELTGWEFTGEESLESDLKSYRFAKAGQSKRVVWSLASDSAVIRTNQPVEITDMMGNAQMFTPVNGNIYITLTGEPIYIKGEIQGISKDATFAVHGESSLTGEPVTLQVEMNNTSTEALDYTLGVEGNSYPLHAAPGQTKLQSVVVSGLEEPGTRLVKGVLKSGGQIGLLQHAATVNQSESIRIRPITKDATPLSQSIKVQVQNHSKVNALPVHGVDWQLGALSGHQELNQVMQPEAIGEFDVALQNIELAKSYTANVNVAYGNNKSFTYTGSIEFNPVYSGTVNVDGNPDPLIIAKPPTIDLSKGNVKVNGYKGADDLSGSLWLNRDENYFYLTASIKDDIYAFPATDVNMWNNDSIQFAISNGLPGEDPNYYEYGISQTPAGPQIYRWITPSGVAKGLVADGIVHIARDETQKLTTYEMALPWSELAPIRTENGVFSFSLVVNENDGNLRRGYIEWGGGIGDGKAPSKFRTMQWVQSLSQQ
ncbi:DNRLRE domain-containing protein [Paenibacillus sp. RC67]|uniref:CBM96 family carbohydrate-binding protein n=1 Tax=Paenibacillus sp. RC67 TaxID=3039392 RepID=UPI0024AE6C85|nr:DNRLRE domain-containing protein [Paenibacillus sp. RC67]